MRDNRKLLKEYSTYPSYMSFSIDEMKEILDSFMSIIGSIKQSLKLAWATIELNLKVIQGSWTNNKEMIDAAYKKFQTKRQKYDKDMVENLQYFKKYYLDSRMDTLGGFGPRILAFAANPLLFVAGEVGTSTLERGTGVSATPDWVNSKKKSIEPYDVRDKWTGAFVSKTKARSDDDDDDVGGRGLGAVATTSTSAAGATPNVRRALEFFQFDASRLSEQAAAPAQQATPEQTKEALKLQGIAAEYVRSETEHSKQFLENVSNLNASMKDLLNAKTFEELIQVMKSVEKTGIKMSIQGIQTASKNIRQDFERQLKEDPEKFKAAVKLMQQRSPEIAGPDPIESAMKFIFGISKTKMQQQLIKSQEELLASARKAMNLPIDPATRAQLQQTDIGQQYLTMVDDFERKLVSGERETQAAKKSFKSAAT